MGDEGLCVMHVNLAVFIQVLKKQSGGVRSGLLAILEWLQKFLTLSNGM